MLHGAHMNDDLRLLKAEDAIRRALRNNPNLNYTKLGAQTGVHATTVRYIAAELGLPLRKSGPADGKPRGAKTSVHRRTPAPTPEQVVRATEMLRANVMQKTIVAEVGISYHDLVVLDRQVNPGRISNKRRLRIKAARLSIKEGISTYAACKRVGISSFAYVRRLAAKLRAEGMDDEQDEN